MIGNREKQRKNNIFIIILLICFLILLIFLLRNKKQVDKNEIIENEIESSNSNEENLIMNKLQKMDERDRMEYYFSIFLENIESGEYEEAYKLLDSKFKENYFPTLTEFSEYITKTFSEMSNINHINIERNGDVYILWIEITDAINGNANDKKEMNVVIQENYYNDFVMSFSVI